MSGDNTNNDSKTDAKPLLTVDTAGTISVSMPGYLLRTELKVEPGDTLEKPLKALKVDISHGVTVALATSTVPSGKVAVYTFKHIFRMLTMSAATPVSLQGKDGFILFLPTKKEGSVCIGTAVDSKLRLGLWSGTTNLTPDITKGHLFSILEKVPELLSAKLMMKSVRATFVCNVCEEEIICVGCAAKKEIVVNTTTLVARPEADLEEIGICILSQLTR